MGQFLWYLAVLFVALPEWAAAQSSLSFSPTGTVKGVSQATAVFPTQMVPFGSPTQLAPFTAQCPKDVEGTHRWLDDVTWAYDFKSPLPAGVRCTFTTKSGLKDQKGKPVPPETFSFDTGGPAVSSLRPNAGARTLREDQVFILILDGPVDEKSLADHAYLEIQGLGEKFPMRKLSEAEAKPILEGTWVDDNKPHVLLLQGLRPLPPSAKVTFVWGSGIRSPSGVATTSPQRFDYQVRPPFQVSFHCARTNGDAPCNPMGKMSVQFSAPVLEKFGPQIFLNGPDNQKKGGEFSEHGGYIWSVSFEGPFQPKARYEIQIPSDLKDDFNRPVSNKEAFPLVFQTADYSPLAKFPVDFGVLEWSQGGTSVPLLLRGVEPSIEAKLLGMAKKDGDPKAIQNYFRTVKGRKGRLASPKVQELRYWMSGVSRGKTQQSVFEDKTARSRFPRPKPFQIRRQEGKRGPEVVGIPIERPGFYVMEFSSPRLSEALTGGRKEDVFVRSAVLVTDLAVHLKVGKDRSVVWVTSLRSGEPVPKAQVRIWNCNGVELASGTTDASGLIRVDKELESKSCDAEFYSRYRYGLWATAEVGQDMAFTHSSWNDGIESWRYQLPTDTTYGNRVSHSVLDRTLLRAGETVSMKHFWRGRTSKGLSIPKTQPKVARIVHGPTNQEYVFPLTWNKEGTATTEWAIPKAAKLGTYNVYLLTNRDRKWENQSASFQVQAFKVPLIRANLSPGATRPIGVDSLDLAVSAEYLSGGGASDLPVTVRAQVESASWSDSDYSNYAFARGKARTGKWKQGDSESKEDEVRKWPLTLDKTGAGRVEMDNLPEEDKPYRIAAELELADPNGEIQTISRSIPVYPSEAVIGLYADRWTRHNHRAPVFAQVLDLNHQPMADRPVEIRVFRKKTYSHRKRLLGGYYAYEHFTEVEDAGLFCKGKTDQSGRLLCDTKPPATGTLIFQARTEDSEGRDAYTHMELAVYGDAPLWESVDNHDRLDVLPEKTLYQPGQTARFQLRLPFATAKALIAVEREGVMRSWVQGIDINNPFIEVPIKETDGPNVYVSVLAVRGRAAGPQPPGTIDLGKPAFRYGIAEVRVGWEAHQLKVSVKPGRETYRVRDKAEVAIQVTNSEGKPVTGEVALAAVDEGLLELKGNTTWKLIEAMMARRPYSVETSTLNMHVVGKRHFGQKARADGGDGAGGGDGGGTTRELFDTLLVWNPRLMLDKEGRATVKVPLNDSLTAFRIVAVAHSGQDRFGTGFARIRTSQELMLFAGMPSVLRWGDEVSVPLTVRNSAKRPLSLGLTLKTTPKIEGLKKQFIELTPGQSQEVQWRVKIPSKIDNVSFHFTGSVDGKALDSLKVVSTAQTPTRVRVIQGTLRRMNKAQKIEIELPQGADPKLGGVRVQLDRSLVGSLAGVKKFFAEYPFTCLEQRVSQAVGLESQTRWKKVVGDLPTYLDGNGLAKFFTVMEQGSVTLTSYLLSLSAAAGFEIPGSLRDRMLQGLMQFVDGKITVSSQLGAPDLVLKKIGALETLTRYGQKVGSQVKSIEARPNLWPTSTLLDWILIHRRLGQQNVVANAKRILRGRLVLQGTSLGFTSENQDRLWWLMTSPDTNAVRTLLTLLAERDWANMLPRLARGTIGRQQRGHWDLTTANAWGVLALRAFAKQFERRRVSGASMVSLDDQKKKLKWNSSRPSVETTLNWPGSRQTLNLSHVGQGTPWAFVQSLAAVPLTEALFSGFQVKKEWIPIEQKTAGKWSRGDVVRVRLTLRAQDDRTWVAITDPTPVGASILGSGLGRDSKMLTKDEAKSWETFIERRPGRYQAYYEYRPGGEWTTEYTLRLNTPGRYRLPETRIEAMYSPEVFGEMPNPTFEILP